MTNTIPNFLADLLEGAKALEERPQILEARDNAIREAEFHKSNVDQYKTWHEDMATQIAQLKETIANREADLAQATFREQQVRTQLEMLVGAFKTVVGEAQAAVELVEPKPEPAPVVVTAEPSVGDNTTSPFPASPSPEKASNDTSASNTVTGSLTASEAPDTVTATGTVGGGNGANPGPFAMPQTSDASSSQAAGTDTAPTGNAAASPHGKAYWNKPTPMTWREWTASGGERPHWIEDAQLDTAY